MYSEMIWALEKNIDNLGPIYEGKGKNNFWDGNVTQGVIVLESIIIVIRNEWKQD